MIYLVAVLAPLAASPRPDDSEPPSRIITVRAEDLVRIESPRFISPRTAKNSGEEERIKRGNEIWQQYQRDLERHQKIKSLPPNFPAEKIRDRPSALFYVYNVTADPGKYLDTFNGLYARFQQRQGTLATANRLSSPSALTAGTRLILPVPQGLFIPETAESALEILLQKEFAAEITGRTPVYDIDGTRFHFLEDRNFSQTLIAFFHDTGMQLPLSKKVVTSEFGYRTSPISGTWKFHAGIDLAAPTGTEVYACKHGDVSAVGYNEIYGNYIDIRHAGNTTSRYAHLSKTLVKKGQSVSTGQTIGLVGTTGASTGPHLHFEVRENGAPTDPTKQIRNF